MGNGATPNESQGVHTEEQLGTPPKGALRVPKEKVSDDELLRRRQEVQILKEQIYGSGSRPHVADFRNLLSPPASSPPSFKSPRAAGPRSNARAKGNPVKSPRSASSNASPVADLRSQDGVLAMPYARKGHFDASTLPTHFDSWEVENLRAKLGGLEAKLLSTQSQLVKERESSRTAKARLAMEMQTRMSSAERDFVHSKTGLEHQMDGMQESFRAAKAALDSETKERQLREVEIERLQRTIANMSLQTKSTQQSLNSDDAADNLRLPKSTLKHQDPENPNTKILKIQDLCQVNLALLVQKRSAVKHVVAMNSEIEDISAMLKEVISQMHAATGLDLADEMLATENKALLMAQLQAQSTLQCTELELQSCREELKQTKMQLSALQNKIAEEGKMPLSRRATRSAAPPSKQQQQQQEQGQGVSVTDTFPLVSQKGGVLGAEGSADKADALELAARLQKSEEQADLLRAMFEQEQERSRMQLADLQEELNSVHQSRMSESMRFGNAGLTSQQCIEGISLKLDMQLKDIENPVEFVQAVKLDVCLALGISAARIQMHGLRAGSVIVDMALLEGVNQSDRTPGEILMGLLRQIKDSSSELMRGSMTSKIISIEIYFNERVYQENIKSDGNHNETSCAVDESTRSTSNWIELVEQQTRQLKMQTADMVELEAEMDFLKSRNRQLEDHLHNTQTDANNWKRAFDNLEAQLNQHNDLIKKHLESAEGRADDLQREKVLLAAELKNMTERYVRASQESLIKVSSRDSVRSVETVDSDTIITESAMVLTPNISNITRAAPPPVPARTSPLAVRSLSLSAVIDTVPIVSERGVVFVAAGMSSAEPTTTREAHAPNRDSSRGVDMSLNLSLPFEAAGKEGSMERSAFEKQLKEDLAHSSGMPTSSFAIKNLAMTELASSFLLDLSITPHQITASGPEPLEVAVELEKQAQDHTSRLRNAALTRHVAEVAVNPTLTVLVQYKMTREENQRLREQVQNLRAQALKGDAEIESRSSKIKDLQKELAEHLTMAKQLQAQVDSSIRQLKKVQNDNAELASRLERADAKAEKAIQELEEAQKSRKANEGPGGVVDELQRRNREFEDRLREAEEQLHKVALVLEQRQQQEEELSLKHHELTRDFGREKLEKEELQRECQSSQAVIEKLKAHLAQERSETEDLIAKMSKVTHEKEEALQRMRDAESHLLKSSGEVIQDLAARLQEERSEKEAASTKSREANQQIHDLQVQGVQLAQAKIFLEEKVVLLAGMHEKEKEEILRELNKSRHRAAELESLCAASTQRVEELMHKMDKKDGDNSERPWGDEMRDKSISDLEMRLEGLRLELDIRDKQISKLQEALSSTRSKIKAPGNSSPQNSTRLFSFESPRFTGDDAGKIQPFYGGYSQSQSMQDDIEMRIATPHQLKVQRTAAPPPRTSQSYSPVSSPSTSPLNSVPGSIFGYTPIGQPASNSATRGSNTQPSRATVPDVKPTFPASTQLSFFHSKPTYQGELKEGWPHGRGITVWPDGRVYDGHWRQGIFQGKGTCVWSNGDTYEGEWLEGFAHGLGMYTYSNGDAFEGEFKQDKFHGHGAFSSAQNVKYRGCWDHGDLSGWTLVVGKNGEKFKQYFDMGVPVEIPGVPEDLYGSTLLAVGEVVKAVREQTVQIRQARAAIPETDPNQGAVANATPKQATKSSAVRAPPGDVGLSALERMNLSSDHSLTPSLQRNAVGLKIVPNMK